MFNGACRWLEFHVMDITTKPLAERERVRRERLKKLSLARFFEVLPPRTPSKCCKSCNHASTAFSTLLGGSKAMEIILHCGCSSAPRAATPRANQLISTQRYDGQEYIPLSRPKPLRESLQSFWWCCKLTIHAGPSMPFLCQSMCICR